jgi:hypothetical protein
VMVTGSGLPKARPSALTNKGAKFTVGWVRT